MLTSRLKQYANLANFEKMKYEKQANFDKEIEKYVKVANF